MSMFSFSSSIPLRSRRSTSVTNTSTSRRPQLLVTSITVITMIILVVSCSSSCGSGVTAATVVAPVPKGTSRMAKKAEKKGYSSGSDYYTPKASKKKKSSKNNTSGSDYYTPKANKKKKSSKKYNRKFPYTFKFISRKRCFVLFRDTETDE